MARGPLSIRALTDERLSKNLAAELTRSARTGLPVLHLGTRPLRAAALRTPGTAIDLRRWLDLCKRLGYQGKSVRIGFLHYNTREEVGRLLEALAGVCMR